MNVAGIIKNDTTAGNGICVSLFVCGCPLHCEGCHNPEMQNPNYGTPIDDNVMETVYQAISANGFERSFCLLGGEPLAPYNLAESVKLLRKIRERFPYIDIYVWTGFTIEELLSPDERCIEDVTLIKELFDLIDYLVDGPFILEQRDVTLKMRGSRNQRVFDIARLAWVEDYHDAIIY